MTPLCWVVQLEGRKNTRVFCSGCARPGPVYEGPIRGGGVFANNGDRINFRYYPEILSGNQHITLLSPSDPHFFAHLDKHIARKSASHF